MLYSVDILLATNNDAVDNVLSIQNLEYIDSKHMNVAWEVLSHRLENKRIYILKIIICFMVETPD